MRRPAVPVPPEPTLADLTPDQRLRRLELTVTRRLDGLLHGQHRGLLPGPGSEAAGSREYRPGEDEVRRMDWAVTARTTVPHVREVDADRELTTWLLVDASPSMEYGTATLDKRELAVAAVAAVGFLTAGVGNRLGAYVLAPDGVRRFPARNGRTHLLGLLRALLTAPRMDDSRSAGPTPRRGLAPSAGGYERDRPPDGPRPGGVAGPPMLVDGLAGVQRMATRRGLVVVVSDFLDGLPDDPAAAPPWEALLRRLAVRHQVLAVEVTDPRELELPDVGLITLVDPESGRCREVWTGDRNLRERYAEAAAAQRDQVRQALRRSGTTHLALRTDRDWSADIVRHVHAQRRLAAAPAASRGGVA
ncbi:MULTISPECIES: DUF58 domain-containing protein [Micromonospora]|uniref:DUF58 domain-containing protein n=1 Tax=Micromonospora solifontis TaxID=2487138 RepID=A0ABX9WM34_9ACTN|nr:MULTISPECIES: DUF58 domain-containing protein [Micromonospora]NES14061.1 DUF58 domain-containing protein [Micromonospora sp. PPF5-17B]NES35691.1 DUF58 domain-containing protein [Micromonospora solifontis]NES56062.1 DUF58 domain-containing protein [Micromonospora sp. PPF5-6]RNM00372.1 DUF58 domain-containing protein [Micromonospora solifontis]